MSFLLSRNAAKCTLGSPSAKAVLRCLCDYADDDGTNCRPSTETISLETELDRRTVFKAVSFLSSNDWLKVFNAGRGSRNFYALNVQKINNGFEQAKVTKEIFKSESGIKFDTSSENATSDKKDTKSSGKNDTRYKNDTSNNNVTRSSNKNVTSNENATSDKNVSGVVTFLQESGSKNDTQLYQYYTNTKSNIDAHTEDKGEKTQLATDSHGRTIYDLESGEVVPEELLSDFATARINSYFPEKKSEEKLPAPEQTEVVETAPLSSKPKTEEKHQSCGTATKTQASVTKPDDVSADLWADFLAHKKHKKAPVTNRVITLIRNEAKKAGWTLEEALNEVILRNWVGFKAEWVEAKDPNAVWVRAEDYQPELPPVEYAPSARECFDRIMAKSTYAYDIKDLSQLERVVKKEAK